MRTRASRRRESDDDDDDDDEEAGESDDDDDDEDSPQRGASSRSRVSSAMGSAVEGMRVAAVRACGVSPRPKRAAAAKDKPYKNVQDKENSRNRTAGERRRARYWHVH